MTHAEYADGLRQIASWWEQHPAIRLPHDAAIYHYFSAISKHEIAELMRALGGEVNKKVDGTFFCVTKQFGTITFEASAYRGNICTKREVGVMYVPEVVTSAKVVPAHTIPQYEWDCPESLLAEGDNNGTS